jgi:hypothetical protein
MHCFAQHITIMLTAGKHLIAARGYTLLIDEMFHSVQHDSVRHRYASQIIALQGYVER